MKSYLLAMATALVLIAISGEAECSPVAIYVSEFASDQSIQGSPKGSALKNLIVSRLNKQQTRIVDHPEQADIIMNGSYNSIGKMFSLDIKLKDKKSGSIATVFEQGNAIDDVIPAVGRLANKIDNEIKGICDADSCTAPFNLINQTLPILPTTDVTQTKTQPVISTVSNVPAPASSKPAKESYIISGEPETIAGTWSSDTLSGIFISMAVGRKLSSGALELFVVSERTVRLYHKDSELKLLAEETFPATAQILAIDSADIDRDGTTELFVTIVDRNKVSSRVYRVEGTKLKLIAENLPWLLRGIGTDVATRTIYAQEMSVTRGYTSEVREVVWNGRNLEMTGNLKLPRTGTIFNFQQIRDAKGNRLFVTINEDGYLVVTDTKGEEIWKSAQTFGGSESRFKDFTFSPSRASRDLERWSFSEQRITLLTDGSFIVPKNDGAINIGYNRNFNRHTLFAFRWNGSVLTETWHSRQATGYLADYAFDADKREVILLKILQRPGLFSTGKTIITTNRID